MLATVASGRRSAPEWYTRENDAAPADAKVSLPGSYRSALRPSAFGTRCPTEPPEASTVPFGRSVAFRSVRPVDMDAAAFQRGGSAERSMISVVRTAGSPPPNAITFGVYAGGYSPSRTAEPYERSPVTAAD